MFGAASSIDMFANFCQEIMAVLGTRIGKCLIFVQCLKSQTFSDSCGQNCHDLLAKIGEHIDGTSGAERVCNTDWTLESRICDNIGVLF